MTCLHENTKLSRESVSLCGRTADLFVYISVSPYYLSFLIQHISHEFAIHYSTGGPLPPVLLPSELVTWNTSAEK